MKPPTVFTILLQCLFVPSLSKPISRSTDVALQARNVDGLGTVENDVRDGPCKETMFFYVRGSSIFHRLNMGRQPGPQIAAYLRQTLGAGNIAIQGIEYSANIKDNFCFNNKKCSPTEAESGASQVREYMAKCPVANVLMGAYSQGGAMLSAMLHLLDQELIDRIDAAVTFGSTMQVSDENTLPRLPPEKVKMFCNTYDPVW